MGQFWSFLLDLCLDSVPTDRHDNIWIFWEKNMIFTKNQKVIRDTFMGPVVNETISYSPSCLIQLIRRSTEFSSCHQGQTLQIKNNVSWFSAVRFTFSIRKPLLKGRIWNTGTLKCLKITFGTYLVELRIAQHFQYCSNQSIFWLVTCCYHFQDGLKVRRKVCGGA